MDLEIKKLYDEVLKFYRESTKIEKTNINFDLSEIEKKWLEIVDHIYIIGTENSISNAVESELIKQGLGRIVSKFIIPTNTFLKDYFTSDKKMVLLQEWLNEPEFIHTRTKPQRKIGVFAVHISHSLIAEDAVKNNYKNILVFEDDCSFKTNVSVDYLDKLLTNFNKHINIGFLNLGGYNDVLLFKFNEYVNPQVNHINNPIILKIQSGFAQSYIMNLETAKKMSKSIDSNSPMIKNISNLYSDEQYFRAGADDFFYGFIESYLLVPGLTYQKNIGSNVERMSI